MLEIKIIFQIFLYDNTRKTLKKIIYLLSTHIKM